MRQPLQSLPVKLTFCVLCITAIIPVRAKAEVDPLAASLILGGLVAADDSIDQWVREHNGSGGGVAQVISDLGSPPVLYVATWYAEHNAGSKESKEYYHLARKALGSTTVATTALKYATGRSRPDQEDNGDDSHFGPSLSYDSFPSAHSASAFALAEVMSAKEPTKKTLYYGAATAVSLSRIYIEKHHASDVFAGAVIGHYIARYTLKHKHGPFEWSINF